MIQDLFGRVIAVRSPLVDESGWLATVWYVAIDDDGAALDAVRAQGGISSEDELLLIGQLEPDAMVRLALSPGQAIAFP